jgi:hypothetical protein
MSIRRKALSFSILLLLGLWLPACLPVSSTPEAVMPSLSPPASEPPAAPQPTPIPRTPTGTPEPAATATLRQQPTQPPTPTAEPTPTRPPLPTATPTAEPAPAPLAFEGPAVSYSGISFSSDLVLERGVFAEMVSESFDYARFSFAPDGYCREVGCVMVYPVEAYREEIFFGDDIIDGLQSAIETQSKGYFPTLMAHVLLRAQTEHIGFQNGAGIRAIVMKGQDLVLANNGSVEYEFHGLTDDGRYYVEAMFPIQAPILLSTYDPAENTNEAAIPVPELPADDVQRGVVMREYNQEAQRQLDMLDGSSFTPALGLLDALVASLLVAPPTDVASTGSAGFLEVDVDYVGTWYRETFGYTRQAENVKHYVLVMPESQVDRATAADVFSSLSFTAGPGVLSIREDRRELAWTLEYVYEAPGGYYRGQFEPGIYYVAAAFVAAPISREEAGHPDDAILYPGITGGGASTDYWRIAIKPGENSIVLRMTDGDGWACPWLYIYDGHSLERRTEILRNVRGRQNERTETSSIGPVEIVDGSVTLVVAEERDEISFIDELYIVVDGIEVRAEADPYALAKVAERDRDYLIRVCFK